MVSKSDFMVYWSGNLIFASKPGQGVPGGGVLLVDWVLWRPGLGRTRSIVEVCCCLMEVLLDLQAITGETASLRELAV